MKAHAGFLTTPAAQFVPPRLPVSRAFFRTDELCREPVKAGHGLTKSCNQRAIGEPINGRWMCARHRKKATR